MHNMPAHSTLSFMTKRSTVMRLWRLLVAALLSASGIITPASATTDDIVVTIPPLAGLIRMLEPELQPTCLLPAHADPHHFELTPRLVDQLRSSSLTIRSLPDDGEWSFLSRQPHMLSLWREQRHAWLIPAQVSRVLSVLAAALIAQHPDHKQAINQRLTAAIARTTAIEQQWEETFRPWRKSGVIMQHPAWKPLLEQHHVPVLAILESGRHGTESGPHTLEHALNVLQQHPGALLLADARHDNRALHWLANRQASPLITLDPMGSCQESWDELMLRNISLWRQVKP